MVEVRANVLKTKWGFERKAGTHYMYVDRRKVADQNLYVSLHGETDGTTYSFRQFAIKTGVSEEPIGCLVDLDGQVRIDPYNAAWVRLTARDQENVRAVAGEMESLIAQSAIIV